MNVLSFLQWSKYFHLVKVENICTIALINIHYLYTILKRYTDQQYFWLFCLTAQHVYNADIIQPGLMQLEPDFDDDFMDTLESLTGEFHG